MSRSRGSGGGSPWEKAGGFGGRHAPQWSHDQKILKLIKNRKSNIAQIYIYLYITGSPISQVQGGRLESSRSDPGGKNVIFVNRDHSCPWHASHLRSRLRKERIWESVQRPKMMVLLRTSFKNHIVDKLADWTASTTFLGGLQASNSGPKAFILVSPWGIRLLFAIF